MRSKVIFFHVVPAAMKRQYELLSAQSELSPPQSNRVRFSQDFQQPGDRASLVGAPASRSGPQPGLNNKWVWLFFLYFYLRVPYIFGTLSKHLLLTRVTLLVVLPTQCDRVSKNIWSVIWLDGLRTLKKTRWSVFFYAQTYKFWN